MTNVELRVVNASDEDVQPGEIGEIVTRGPHVIRQYHKRPEADAAAFRGGWFHTGDMARLEEDGYLTVVDRREDTIISGGENVYPQEVEEVLYGHAKVLECTVFGIPDEKWVEAVCAAIVVRPGCEVTEEEIMDYCKINLAAYKRPKRVQFMESLPKTPSGKIQKQKLRELHWRGTGRKI
jgi:acyl-CoA synthetase (AMP-forming)/AMP-acid ligase II